MQTFTKVGLDALLTPENCAVLPQTIGYALSDSPVGPGYVDLRKVLQLD
jgi:hypothetical protein